MYDPTEAKRLEHLVNAATREASAAERQQHERQLELARDRTQYFEKIALGSGATIAAVVSFIGAHKDRLQPPWLFRAALVALVVAMFAAMYRNFRYPYYLMNVWQGFKLSKWEARERSKRNYFAAVPAHSLQDGKPIDGAEWARDFDSRIEPALKAKISEFARGEKATYRETQIAEALSLVAAVVGISFLVLLAWKNF